EIASVWTSTRPPAASSAAESFAAAGAASINAAARAARLVLGVGRNLDLHHLVGIRGRLALLDLVDVFHARRHLAPHGVLAVEEVGVLEADEELATRRVGIVGACHRDGAAAVRLLAEF